MRLVFIRVFVLAGFLAQVTAAYSQSIVRTDSAIDVVADAYRIHIQTSDAQCIVADAAGRQYCTFPLWAAAEPAGLAHTLTFVWQTHDTVISYVATDNTGRPLTTCALTCAADAFRVNFTVHAPDTMQFVRYHQGWQTMNTYNAYNATNYRFKIAGHKYENGIWTHAVSVITMPIPDSAVRFLTDCGRDDGESYPTWLQFEVGIGDSVLYLGEKVTVGTEPQHINVAVPGGKLLTLRVLDGGDGYPHDHADWAAPRFVTARGDTIDAALWARHHMQGLNYFSLNERGMQFPDGYATIYNPAPNCEPYSLYGRAEIGAEADYYCGYMFNPPPTVFSYYSSAANAWMGIGLMELPDAGKMQFLENYLDLNIQWTKRAPDSSAWFSAPGMCFVFDANRWHNVDRYRRYLVDRGAAPELPARLANHPSWWDKLTVCPWGDQDYIVFKQHGNVGQSWLADYLDRAEKLYADSSFTFLIDDMWRKWQGDVTLNDSFPALRAIIDTAHARGHHVLLQFPFWLANDSGLACRMGICQRGAGIAHALNDATNPRFPEYVDSLLYKMLGSDGLNADGLKMDFLSNVRDPELAVYADPTLGMGMREQRYALQLWVERAKRIKPGCLLTFTISSPFFNDIVDKVRLNDNGDRWSHFQLRAMTASMASPFVLIDSDGWNLLHDDMEPFYFGACVFSTPSIYYMDHYRDIPQVDSTTRLLKTLFELYKYKQPGRTIFKESEGAWMSVMGDTIVAESLDSNAAFVVRCSRDSSKLIARTTMLLVVPLHGRHLLGVTSEMTSLVNYSEGTDLAVIAVRRGFVYTLRFDSGSSVPLDVPVDAALSVYPNPATDELTVLITQQDVHVTLSNVLGDVVPVAVAALATSTFTRFQLKTAHLAPGTYFVEARSGANVWRRRVVVAAR